MLRPHLPAKATTNHHVLVGLLAFPISDSPSHSDSHRDSDFFQSETFSSRLRRKDGITVAGQHPIFRLWRIHGFPFLVCILDIMGSRKRTRTFLYSKNFIKIANIFGTVKRRNSNSFPRLVRTSRIRLRENGRTTDRQRTSDWFRTRLQSHQNGKSSSFSAAPGCSAG
jgi:hypothetical protein